MLTHLHKVVHLVVGTFEQGGEVGEETEVIFTVKQWLDAGAEVTGSPVLRSRGSAVSVN
jgi:hypothetical protein